MMAPPDQEGVNPVIQKLYREAVMLGSQGAMTNEQSGRFMATMETLHSLLKPAYDPIYESKMETLSKAFEEVYYDPDDQRYLEEGVELSYRWLGYVSSLMERNRILTEGRKTAVSEMVEKVVSLASSGTQTAKHLETLKTSLLVLHKILEGQSTKAYNLDTVQIYTNLERASLIEDEMEYRDQSYAACYQWIGLIAQNLQAKLPKYIKIEDYIGPANRSAKIPTGSYLIDEIRKNTIEVRPSTTAIIGPQGSGKSWTAVSLATIIDPNFTADQIVFTVEQFVTLLKEGNLPKGAVILFDDAGVNANARDWKDEQVNLFGKTMQAMRYLGYVIIFTTPNRSFLESQSRSLLQFELEATKTRGRFKIFQVIPPANRKGTTPWVKKPQIVKNFDTGLEIHTVEMVNVEPPPEGIIQEYERRRHAWFTGEIEDFDTQLTMAEIRKKESMRAPEDGEYTAKAGHLFEVGVYLKCDFCDFTFHYKRPKLKTKCPKCEQDVTVPEEYEKFAGMTHEPLDYPFPLPGETFLTKGGESEKMPERKVEEDNPTEAEGDEEYGEDPYDPGEPDNEEDEF